MKAHTKRWNFNHAHLHIPFQFSITCKSSIFLIVNYTAWLKLHKKTGEVTTETNATATHKDNGETQKPDNRSLLASFIIIAVYRCQGCSRSVIFWWNAKQGKVHGFDHHSGRWCDGGQKCVTSISRRWHFTR